MVPSHVDIKYSIESLCQHLQGLISPPLHLPNFAHKFDLARRVVELLGSWYSKELGAIGFTVSIPSTESEERVSQCEKTSGMLPTHLITFILRCSFKPFHSSLHLTNKGRKEPTISPKSCYFARAKIILRNSPYQEKSPCAVDMYDLRNTSARVRAQEATGERCGGCGISFQPSYGTKYLSISIRKISPPSAFSDNAKYGRKEETPFSPVPRVHLLLRTIVSVPELALYVKRAEFVAPLSPTGEKEDILSLEFRRSMR
ncbi:uncharacterized protein PAC_09917 [Phialocephala subalpina]|uniref:Uncharacterized protein n=1 Tax=Phialocephala subalpina TaxID=576137 RepID=A0A1L7X4T6_9HELO|nr:uncharacterized protein PAC_09917 [Phialocephala subalpina]